jgi:hypothetical protein
MHPSKKPLPLSLPRHLLDLAAWLAGGALRLVRAAAAGVVNMWYQALLAPALARQGHGPAPPDDLDDGFLAISAYCPRSSSYLAAATASA